MTWISQAVRRRFSGWVFALGVGLLLAIWVLNVSSPGTAVQGCPRGCADKTGRRLEGPLRLMSLNVLHGFPRFEHLSDRLALIAREIRDRDADVVCLQEVPWTRRLGSGAEYLAQLTGLNHVYVRANGNRWTILFEEGVVILSRYPLTDLTWVELEPQAGFFEHRVALHAAAVTPWGSVHIFVTHLTHGAPDINRGQAASLMAFVEATTGGPAIVAGDLNATEDTPQIQALSRSWTDAYRSADPLGYGLTCCIDDLNQGPDEPLEKRIDYVFLVPWAEGHPSARSVERVWNQPVQVSGRWQWASDHIGLLTAVDIANE